VQGAGLHYLSGMKRSPKWERCSVLFACATGLYHRKELWHVNIVISDNVGGRMEPGVKMPSGVVQTQGRAGQGRADGYFSCPLFHSPIIDGLTHRSMWMARG
jgi:hypothetical protein